MMIAYLEFYIPAGQHDTFIYRVNVDYSLNPDLIKIIRDICEIIIRDSY